MSPQSTLFSNPANTISLSKPSADPRPNGTKASRPRHYGPFPCPLCDKVYDTNIQLS
jgi:hypothetical protein